mmetsp:Transcript_32734/g.63970  ORF Transcript_32734/g.63970 Transcript_32734/m.63970 type:complete len:87 (-) Transcript_32734:58-318(-)
MVKPPARTLCDTTVRVLAPAPPESGPASDLVWGLVALIPEEELCQVGRASAWNAGYRGVGAPLARGRRRRRRSAEWVGGAICSGSM